MPKINAGGYLTRLCEEVMSGSLEKGMKLNTADLERICTYYGYLAKREPTNNNYLYDLLFEGENELVKVDGDEINTKDLMWFTMLDHSRARGWFYKPNGTFTTDTSVNHAVPLAFKGARRVFNKPYMSWLNVDSREDRIKCDMFLPQGLNSYCIDENGEVQMEQGNNSRGGGYGLIYRYMQGFEFTPSQIHRLRESVPLYATTSKPKKVRPNDISDTDEPGDEYNKSSFVMRSMILQGWIFYKPSRHSDQITNYMNWDKFPPSVDNTFEGLDPKTTRIPEGFFKFTKSKEKDLLLMPTEEDL